MLKQQNNNKKIQNIKLTRRINISSSENIIIQSENLILLSLKEKEESERFSTK